MHYISKAEDWIIDLYPEDTDYGSLKLSDYAIIEPYLDGYIVFHSITWSQYFLTKEEYDNILSNSLLIKNKVVLDNTIDEEPIAEEAYIKRAVAKNKIPYDTIGAFTIYTTNECNANCNYCFETLKIGEMSTKTADKVVDFIKSKAKKDKKIKLNWFGGEPLKNKNIIDYITEKLIKDNIDFYSEIVTNGLLFSNDILQKAIDTWKLTLIQVTIDGPEKIYNDIKNYDNYNGENPFKDVINNMLYISLNSNIRISIRINISLENMDSVEELLQTLDQYFSGNVNVSTYLAPIYQINDSYSLKEKCDFYEKLNLLKKNHSEKFNIDLFKKQSLIRCMADSCDGIAIGIDGKLYNCEHIGEKTLIGNVCDGITNKEKVNETVNKGGKNIEICKKLKCKLLPICGNLTICYPSPKCKDEEQCEAQKYGLIISLKNNVDYYLEVINKKK